MNCSDERRNVNEGNVMDKSVTSGRRHGANRQNKPTSGIPPGSAAKRQQKCDKQEAQCEGDQLIIIRGIICKFSGDNII